MFPRSILLVLFLLFRCIEVPDKGIVLYEQHNHGTNYTGHKAEQEDVHEIHFGVCRSCVVLVVLLAFHLRYSTNRHSFLVGTTLIFQQALVAYRNN